MAESNEIGSLYHYTDLRGISGIRLSCKIRQSTASTSGTSHSMFGSGVYFTKMSPSAGKISLLSNNFRAINGRSRLGNPMRKCDYYIKVDAKYLPGVVKVYAGGRDVYRYSGDVDLKDIPFMCGETDGSLPSITINSGESGLSFRSDDHLRFINLVEDFFGIDSD